MIAKLVSARLFLAMLLGLILIVGALAASLNALVPRPSGQQLSLDGVQNVAFSHQVKQATFLEQDARVAIENKDGGRFWAAYPAQGSEGTVLISQLVTGGAQVHVDQQWSKKLLTMLAQFILPLLLLADLFGIFMLLARGGGSQVRELFAFSRIGLRRSRPSGAGITFKDVASAGEAVEELAEVRDYLTDPRRFGDIGATAPKGVLLYGPPGCGKTLLARALAGEAGVPFYFISGSEFVESLVGVGAARVRDLFRTAVRTAPCIIFVDELDAAGRKRGAGLGGGNDEREQTLNEMLVQMDGFAPSSGVVVIAATNRPDILDPALLRPGRFDRHIAIEPPDAAGRLEILQLHARKCRLAPAVNLEPIARMTPGFSGADLANVVNEAALMAVRRGADDVHAQDFIEGVHRVRSGPRRRATVLSPEEVRRLSYHEAGHAVVAAELGVGEPQRLSIIARGRSLGMASVMPSGDGVVRSREQLLDEMTVAMAGTAAEELVTGSGSTAGESDLESATDMARRFAGRYGLSEAVGKVRVVQRDAEVFLGRDYMVAQHLSPHTLERVDEAVRQIVEESGARATRLLEGSRAILDAVAARLSRAETLEGPELRRLLGLAAEDAVAG